MKIIYISKTCSQKRYFQYIESKNMRASQQAQKYNILLAEGLANNEAQVHMVSTMPINESIDDRLFFRRETESADGLEFRYVPFINKPLIRNISFIVGTIKELVSIKKEKQMVYMCDALNIAASIATLLVGKIKRIKCVAIITDVPCYRPISNSKVPLNEKVNLWLMRKYDAYLLLTQQMNKLVNPTKKPSIVLEGHVDEAMNAIQNDLEKKHKKKVCLYAGSLRKIYGIEMLVNGFLKAKVDDAELHIYGDGDFAESLCEIAKKHPNVKYFGVMPNDVVLREELKATLLINPRPTNEEYTKYSFPSKNMEYMASGTPILTTKLPGMPEEYHKYIYMIEDESEDGIKIALEEVLAISKMQLHTMGEKAKDFVIKEKNNDVQALKILKWIKAID